MKIVFKPTVNNSLTKHKNSNIEDNHLGLRIYQSTSITKLGANTSISQFGNSSILLLMKHLCFIILIISHTNCNEYLKSAKQGEPLFLISDLGKFGFIDSTGLIVIEPKFLALGEFSEGLAYARVNGTYGYLDCTGAFAIKPQFDYATSFSDGLAVVYKDGKPFYINNIGKKAFDCNFSIVGKFENGRAIVQTSTNKFGVINKQGKLIIDTFYTQFRPIADGMIIVQGINHHPYKDIEKAIVKTFEVGVIDTLGNFIIPYGKFQQITNYEKGYFVVEIPEEPWDSIDGYSAKTAVIDKTGRIIISKDHKNSCYIYGNLHCGLAKMYLYKYWIPEDNGIISTSEKSYEGFMNFKGEVVINDTNFESVEDFSENRAFVRDNALNYSIINTQGKFVAKNAFSGIKGNGFKGGVAFVSVNYKWGLIDTNANFIFQPKFIEINELGMIDDYFFFEEKNPNSKSRYDNLSGVAKKDGSVLIKPIMEDFDHEGFKNGLLKCIIDGKLTYLSKCGKIVWQERKIRQTQLSNLNVDYMNRGYFHAYSLTDKREVGGGWAISKNTARKISKKFDFRNSSSSINVVVESNVIDTFSKTYKALTVYVLNNTNSNVNFNAQDSRLYMKVQAINNKGEWKDIEYLPSSWCGNSYHVLVLNPNCCWKLVTPVYEGDYNTKLRIELKCIDPSDKSETRWKKKEITIYSNEYKGSINPGQFWRKQDYYSNGIMDPYID